MKLGKYAIILLVILGLLVISRLGCNNGLGFFDKPKADTVVVRDTSWQVHDSLIVKKVLIKETIYNIDTLTLPPQYIADTNYPKLKAQFDDLVKLLLSKNIYADTLKLDTLGYVAIADTIQENKLQNRGVHYSYKIPTITEKITITKEAPKKNQLYIGGGVNFNRTLMPQGLEAGLILKTKKDQIYNLSAGSDINGNVLYGFQSYWKIGKKK
jgi:hypothetical protein